MYMRANKNQFYSFLLADTGAIFLFASISLYTGQEYKKNIVTT